MELANLIKFRQSLGFSQKDFASELGIKQTTYNGYEKGKSDPGSDFFARIALKYNVSVDYLLGVSTKKQINKVVSDGDSATRQRLIKNLDAMNEFGHEKLLEYSELLLKDDQFLVCDSTGVGTA